MISLLKFASAKPDKSAFSESDIDFVIEGDHIYLARINFKGDAISLEGAGEMDFNRNLNLTFGTRLGRGDRNLPILRELLGNAGDQIVVIHVEGPASNPKIVRQPLPAMNRMIEQLQKDLQIPVQTPGAFPDFRAEADRRTAPGQPEGGFPQVPDTTKDADRAAGGRAGLHVTKHQTAGHPTAGSAAVPTRGGAA